MIHWVTKWVKTKEIIKQECHNQFWIWFVLTFDGSGWRVRVVSGQTVSPLGLYCLRPEPVSYIDMALQPRGGALCGRSCGLAKLLGVCHFRVLFSFWREFNWNEGTKQSQTIHQRWKCWAGLGDMAKKEIVLRCDLTAYLALHESQLLTKMAVDLEELLDLSFRGSEGTFHFHELLYRDGAVRQVWRFWALRGEITIQFDPTHTHTHTLLYTQRKSWCTLVRSSFPDVGSFSVSSSDATLS